MATPQAKPSVVGDRRIAAEKAPRSVTIAPAIIGRRRTAEKVRDRRGERPCRRSRRTLCARNATCVGKIAGNEVAKSCRRLRERFTALVMTHRRLRERFTALVMTHRRLRERFAALVKGHRNPRMRLTTLVRTCRRLRESGTASPSGEKSRTRRLVRERSVERPGVASAIDDYAAGKAIGGGISTGRGREGFVPGENLSDDHRKATNGGKVRDRRGERPCRRSRRTLCARNATCAGKIAGNEVAKVGGCTPGQPWLRLLTVW